MATGKNTVDKKYVKMKHPSRSTSGSKLRPAWPGTLHTAKRWLIEQGTALPAKALQASLHAHTVSSSSFLLSKIASGRQGLDLIACCEERITGGLGDDAGFHVFAAGTLKRRKVHAVKPHEQRHPRAPRPMTMDVTKSIINSPSSSSARSGCGPSTFPSICTSCKVP